MASAYEPKQVSKAAEDELDTLFKTFDSQFQDLQQKFSDIERNLQELQRENSGDEEDGNS